jgi:hypothetical protein
MTGHSKEGKSKDEIQFNGYKNHKTRCFGSRGNCCRRIELAGRTNIFLAHVAEDNSPRKGISPASHPAVGGGQVVLFLQRNEAILDHASAELLLHRIISLQ